MPKTVSRHLHRATRPRPIRARSLGGSSGLAGFLSAPSQAGVDVTPTTALNLSAVYAAINVISADLASLPTITYRVDASGSKIPNPDDPLFDLVFWEPSGEMDSFHFTQAIAAHALGIGNGYAGIERSRATGDPLAIRLLEPSLVEPARNKAGRLLYDIDGEGQLFPEDVIHLKAFTHNGINGISIIDRARDTIGLGKACEISGASFFGNGAQPNGFIKTSKRLSEEATEGLRESVYREHGGPYQSHKLGILVGDYEWVPTSVTPEAAQFLATREFTVVEIARWFNINPIKLMDYTHGNYSNVENSELDYMRTTLNPWVVRWERELNRKLLARWDRRRRLIACDVTARLRGDSAARVAYYSGLFSLAAISPNEIRTAENLNRIEGGDEHYIPTNNFTPIGQLPAPGQTTPPAGDSAAADPSATEAGTAPGDDLAGADELAAVDRALDEMNA